MEASDVNLLSPLFLEDFVKETDLNTKNLILRLCKIIDCHSTDIPNNTNCTIDVKMNKALEAMKSVPLKPSTHNENNVI